MKWIEAELFHRDGRAFSELCKAVKADVDQWIEKSPGSEATFDVSVLGTFKVSRESQDGLRMWSRARRRPGGVIEIVVEAQPWLVSTENKPKRLVYTPVSKRNQFGISVDEGEVEVRYSDGPELLELWQISRMMLLPILFGPTSIVGSIK